MTFHIGDTVAFTATAANVADRIDGEDGHVTSLARQGALWVSAAGRDVFVRDLADIELTDCPHAKDPE